MAAVARSGRGLDGERQPRAVAGRRQPERLRRGGDRPPVRRPEVERARRAVARGRDLDVDRTLGPRGEEPHLREGPQGHRRDHVEPPGRLALLGGLHGYVGDLQGLAADLESVLDREGRRVLGSPDQRAGSTLKRPTECSSRSQYGWPSGASAGSVCSTSRVAGRPAVRSIGWSTDRPVSG